MKRFLVFFLSFFLVSTIIGGGDVYAKDYSIESATIVVQINPDGSADFAETRTYDFDGSFSWADEWILLAAKCDGCVDYIITDVSLSEEGKDYMLSSLELPGNFNVSTSPGKFYTKWRYKALDERKIFTLKYRVQNAVTNHSDISEFYWRLIGDEWGKGVDTVSATVILAEEAPDDQIWAFGHGPTNGEIYIPTNKKVEFSIDGLPSNQFFEARVLFTKMEGAIYAPVSYTHLTLPTTPYV